jgi:hypothetical protein
MKKILWKGECFEVPTRDSQRSKAYAAERRAFPEMFTKEFDDLQKEIDRVTGSKFWRKLLKINGNPYLKITAVRATRRRAWATRWQVAIPKRMRSYSLLYHELAHAAVGRFHGWNWAATYLLLVRHYLGKEAHDRLKAEFQAGKVRHLPPRKTKPMSPERLEALRAGAAKARAALAAKRAAKDS